MKTKIIRAQMTPDTVEPYARMGGRIPIVTSSSHPRFVPGKRLDWGFVQVALSEGYRVDISPYIEETE